MNLRYVIYKHKAYTLSFDNDGVLDTVVHYDEPLVLLVSTMPVCKFFIKHQYEIEAEKEVDKLTYFLG